MKGLQKHILKVKYGLKDDISVSLIAKFPDILKVEKPEEDEEKIWILYEALSHALDSLISMRETEGEGLKNDLLERTDAIEKVVQEISIRAPEVVKEYKCKLENRIKEILEQQVIDENRLAMEVINQLRHTLNSDSDTPVGRKLDFLIQEMNREINTIGSKANDLSITQNVVEIKSELEKIREQIQNIE